MKITYFVHGTTTDNENHLATGGNQGELSKLGIEQSKRLWGQLDDTSFEVVFCSDLKRAVDSANLNFKDKKEIIIDKRLRECNYGTLNGAPSKEVKGNLNYNIKNKFPEGESYKDVEIRIKKFLDEISQKYKHIAIVAHQAPQLALEVLANKKTWKVAFETDWRNKKEWKPGWVYYY